MSSEAKIVVVTQEEISFLSSEFGDLKAEVSFCFHFPLTKFMQISLK